MIIFDIPYAPEPSGGWIVHASNDLHAEFRSRTDALRYAIDAALHEEQRGDTSAINIEGADGRWRMFDPNAKGLS